MEEEIVDESCQPVDRDERQKTVGVDVIPALVEIITKAVFTEIWVQINNLEKGKSYSIERVMGLGAETFTGTLDPAFAESWIGRLEKCFEEMQCPDDRKLAIAIFLLDERAYDWWEFTRRLHPNPDAISWADFKAMFYKKFYPESYTDAKMDEFLKLKQGSMTVAEYERKFIRLSKYATTMYVTETYQCRHFKYGLRPEIGFYLAAHRSTEFDTLVESALEVEKCFSPESMSFVPINETELNNSSGDNQCGRNRKLFRPDVSNCGSFKTNSREFQTSRFHQSNIQQIKDSEPQVEEVEEIQDGEVQVEASGYTGLPCRTCGKLHHGKCLWGTGLCFNCGQA